jgi:dienelactone hydrolase
MKRAGAAVLLVVAGCGAADVPTPGTDTPASTNAPAATSSTANCAAFAVSGDPRSRPGATWTYASTDAGTEYRLEGVLLTPAGSGPFPAVVVSHGAGGLPAAYSANVGRTMVTWGLVVIATRYTHAADNDGRNATLRPAGAFGASDANVARAEKARALLSCLGYVDMARVAAHGHSMGAFLTAQLVGTHPQDFRAASHTAGGVSPGPNATQAAAAAEITAPYQIHHGDADSVVPLAFDQSLDGILTAHGTRHELHVYGGYTHDQMASDATMLERVRAWYTASGVLP